jgi:NADH-quinone oxidoreductase subunit J
MTLGTFETASRFAAQSPSLLPHAALAQAGAAGGPDTSARMQLLPSALSPQLILIFCVVAGIGTAMLLPSKRNSAPVRGLGGTLVLLAGLLLTLLLVRYAIDATGGPGIYFWVFSAIALFGALRVVTHPRPVYAALYFVLTVFATAGRFVLLMAEFMAAALVIIYAGAILVTYVFVIMLAASTTQAGVDKLAEYDAVSREPVVASAVGFALMGILLMVIFDLGQPVHTGYRSYTYSATTSSPKDNSQVEVSDEIDAPNAMAARQSVQRDLMLSPDRDPEPAYSVQALGRYLFREQAVNLELSGLILTLGMIGAILIARRRVIIPGAPPQSSMHYGTLTAPATPITDDPFSIPVYGTDNPRQKEYPET